LTKRFEQTVVMPAKDAPAWLTEDAHHCQGEFVLVLAGCRLSDEISDEGQLALNTLLVALSDQGVSAKSQVSIAQQVTGLPKARVKEAVYARLNMLSVEK
jgi:16S rRNA (cytidine1402-2'-O)-methyltransferase